MRMGNYRRRKKLTARIAAMLAAVLVLSEVPVDAIYAAQTEQVVGEAATEEKSVNEDSTVIETEEGVEEVSTVSETEEGAEEDSTVVETAEESDEGSAVAETEDESEEDSAVAEIEEEETTAAETEEFEEETGTELQTEETVTESDMTVTAEKTASAESESLDYTFGRELTEEEIEALKALEPSYLPEMEALEFPKSAETVQPISDSVSSVSLATSYDARELGILNEVRNQNPWGTCWAFSTLGTMESALIKEGEVAQGAVDLSERHLAYFVAHTGYDELGNASGDTITSSSTTYYLDKGGNFYYAAMKLMNWHGGADESEYPYITDSDVPDLETETAQDDVAHIENCYWLKTTANNAETIQAVKTMIQQYGCVVWSYYHSSSYLNYSTSAYYNNVNTSTNHAIMVVGWDDNYSKENFSTDIQPTNDGAWIVRNSWGSSWGDDGYFYISYEDTSLGSSNGAAAITANLADDYDNNYFYGNTITYNWKGYYQKAAQVYQIKGKSAEKEQIRAISVMFGGTNTEYSIQLYKNPELTDGVVTNPESGEAMLNTPVTGTTSYAGLYTIEISETIELSADDYVAVVITFPNGDGLIYVDTSGSASSGNYVWEYVHESAPGHSFYDYGTGVFKDASTAAWSFRINMLTDDISQTITTPVIKEISVTEPQGFADTVAYKIYWNKCSNVANYEIYRAESEEGTYNKIGSVSSDIRYYTDYVERENWNTKYYYKVRAVFNDDTSEESAPVEAQAEGVLQTILNSAQYSKDQVTLSWSSMSGAEGYRIERKEKDETEYQQIANIQDVSVTSYVDDLSGVNLGYYEYRVQAYTSSDEAEWSEVVTVAKDLEITPVTASKIKMEWLPVENAYRYMVCVGTSNGSNSAQNYFHFYVSSLEGPTEYTLDISGATYFKTGEDVQVYMKVYDKSSTLLLSTQNITFNTRPDAMNLSATYNSGAIHFTWTGAAGADTIYIYRSMDPEQQGDEPYAVITDTTVCEFEDSSFTDKGTYYYWFYPGVTKYSGEIVYGDVSSYQCKISTGVIIEDVVQQNENSLQITWNAVENADSYAIYRCEEATGSYTLLADNLTTLKYIDTTVTTGKTYYYKVQYVVDGEASELGASNIKKGQTVPDAAVLISKTYDSITIENNTEFSYAIGESNVAVADLEFKDSTESELSFTGLKPETTYYIYARTKQENTGEASVYGMSLEVVTAEYPIAKTEELSAVEANVEIEAYDLNPNSSATLQIQNQNGEIQNTELFAFVSENTDICLVNENGCVTDNSAFRGTEDTTVKVTAKAVGDPENREVVFYVTVLVKKVSENLESAEITEIVQKSENSLKIVWNAIEEVKSYSIYRSEQETGTYVVIAENLTVMEYVDTTVTTGKTYYYKVQCITEEEVSDLEKALPEKGQTVPEAPNFVSKTYDSITIKNNTEFSYAIGEADDVAAELEFGESTEAELTFSGLKPETTYCVYARTKQENTGEAPVCGKGLEVVTAEYPIAKTDKLSAVNANVEIEAYHIDPASSVTLQIQNQNGEIQNTKLFSFVSANSSVCLVDENGCVTANPAFKGTTDKTVKVTAKAVNDPEKREVVFYVTVLTKKYADSLEIAKITNNDGVQETEIIDSFWGQKFVKGEKLTFRAVAYDKEGQIMETPACSWSVSDTSVASVKANKDGTVTVTLKKAARFNLTCKTKDARQSKKVIQIGALVTEPVISTSQVTLNKKVVQEAQTKSSNAFTVLPRNGAIEETPEITEIKNGKKVLTEETGLKKFWIISNADGSYSIGVDEEFLETIKNNTVYTITVQTRISGIPEIGVTESVTESFKIKLKIISKEPSVTVKAAGINRIYTQENDLEGMLTIKASDSITKVRVLSGEEGQINSFDSYFSVEEKEGQWYLQFADLNAQYNKKSISGKLEITVNGYEPVVKKVTVKTTSALPSIKQQSVPVIHASASKEVSISLYNNTEKTLLNSFEIQSVESATLEAERGADGTILLRLKEDAQYKDGATLQAKLSIMAVDENSQQCWMNPVNVTVKVKVYNKKAPTISMKTTNFVLNKQTEGEKAETTLYTNCTNVSILPNSEWKLYAYNSSTKKYDLQGAGFTDWIQMTYDEGLGTVAVGLAVPADEVSVGKYKFRLSGFVEGFEDISKDFTVSVNDKTPTITIKAAGKLDLVKRASSTLTGKMTLKNIPSEVIGVTVLNEEKNGANALYQAELVNSMQFKISMTEAGLAASMTTDKVTLPIELQLKGGQKIQTTMTFKPTQSVPTIKVPAAKTLYKSMPDSAVDYDMSIGQTAGTQIKKMEVVTAPAGLDVTTEDGHLVVKLNDRGIKKGSYKVKVNIYFEGAQAVKGNADGKPVVKTVTVKVVE